jgi:hypothetical protein
MRVNICQPMHITNRQDSDLRDLIYKIIGDQGKSVPKAVQVIKDMRDHELVSAAILTMWQANYSPMRAVDTLITLELDTKTVELAMILTGKFMIQRQSKPDKPN